MPFCDLEESMVLDQSIGEVTYTGACTGHKWQRSPVYSVTEGAEAHR